MIIGDKGYDPFNNATILFVNKATLRTPGTALMHDFLELDFIISGSASYMIGDSTYSVQTGDFIFVNPHTLHHCTAITSDDSISIFTIAVQLDEVPILPAVQHTSPDVYPHFMELINTMLYEHKHKQPYYKLKILSTFAEFLVTFFRNTYIGEDPIETTDSLSRKEQKLLNKALYFIEQHYTDAINIQDIAESIPVSPSYLNRLFQKALNTSPIQHIIWLRLKKAVSIFNISPSISVKETALRCGYSDPYHFSKLFKKHVGVSPAEFKQGKRVKKF